MLHPTLTSSLLLIAAAATIPLAHAAPQAAPPGPSAIPECTYACPALDKAGWQAVPFMDPSPTEIFCSYPTVVNENPLDFYCIYSKIDGHLVFDHNASLCQDYATCTFPGGRRTFRSGNRNPIPKRVQAKGLSEAGGVDVRPSVMKTRVALGKGRKKGGDGKGRKTV